MINALTVQLLKLLTNVCTAGGQNSGDNCYYSVPYAQEHLDDAGFGAGTTAVTVLVYGSEFMQRIC